MRLSDYFFAALNGLKTNRGRSALTILGVVIGIAAVIAMISVGQGAKKMILNQIQSIGANVLTIVPGKKPKGAMSVMTTFMDSLKEKDLSLLKKKENVPHLKEIMPIVFGSRVASYGRERYQPTIIGATNLFAKIYNVYPQKGRLFYSDETKGYASVAIIGHKVKDELFADHPAIGKKIKIGNRKFRVIGLLPQKGQFSFLNFDEVVVTPYTTAQRYIFGIKYFNRLVVEVDSEDNLPETANDIKITLRNSHNITNPDNDDFFIETPAGIMDMMGSVIGILTIFLTFVAAISLLVGGIGIMNIMLVSVSERTREIGLRKAVGARKKDILSQFLLEAVLLTLAGGIIGIILGALFSWVASFALGYLLKMPAAFSLSFEAIALAVGVSIIIGIIFGTYPAQKAAGLSPIEALRYE